jgi:hypothetical protein
MAETTDRNIDLPDLIVNLQRASQAAAPSTALQLYIYKPVPATPDVAVFSDTVTATPSGPHYYASPTGGQDKIVCGFWTAS